MKTLHGFLEWVSLRDPRSLISFDGEIYTVPEGSNWRAIGWLVTAAATGHPLSYRLPVTLEVDDERVIWRAAVKVDEERSVAFSLPDGALTFSGFAPSFWSA